MNQSPISSNIQYVVRNLLNKFNASGTTEHSSESEKEKHSTKYFCRYVTKVTWHPPPLTFFVTVCDKSGAFSLGQCIYKLSLSF